MRELREAADVSLRRTADRSGWDRGHLSRVERGATKPSLALVRWYDTTFGAGGVLVQQFQDMDAAVRRARAVELDRGRGRDSRLPDDSSPTDRAELVAETVAAGTPVTPGQRLEQSWRLRNAGDRPWRGRYLTRQGQPGPARWLRSPARVPIPATGPGEEVDITVPLRAPLTPGPSTAHFQMTDDASRRYFPDDPGGAVACSVLVVEHEGRPPPPMVF